MSYCDLSATARTAPKAARQPNIDEFERDIKANIEAIQRCARSAAAGQLDGGDSKLFPGHPSDPAGAAQHLSSGRALAMATERLFRDWEVQWAGEPAERCRKRCAHDRLRKALADAVLNLDEAARLAATAQAAETETTAAKDDPAAFDGAEEEEASLLGHAPTESEKGAARFVLLPSWLGNAAARWGPWRATSPFAAAGRPSPKDRSLDVTAGDLPDLAGRLLALQEVAYKFFVVAAVLFVLALGLRTSMSSRATASSMALRGSANTGSFAFPAGDVAVWLDGTGDDLLPAVQGGDDNATSPYELGQAPRVKDITDMDQGVATSQQSIATSVSHKTWGATAV